MFKLFAMVCVCLLADSTHSAVSRLKKVPPPAKYACEPGCYNPELDIMLPTEELYAPDNGSCKGYYCQADGETQIQTCGKVGVPAGCRAEYDETLPYPGCCDPEIVCD